MKTAIAYSRASLGIRAPLITIETHISNGIPAFSIVGLPETAVKESRDRVRSALLNTQFEFPARRITVNLAPADLPKYGSRFDLPIALSILAASGQIPAATLESYEFAGELSLSGELRSVSAILPFSIACYEAQKHLIIPYENAEEAKLVEAVTVYGARTLTEVCAHLTDAAPLTPYQPQAGKEKTGNCPDLNEVHGQDHAKRALEIAAAGGHSLLFFGPPGTGKSMLAARLPGILPPMTEHEALAVAAIYSISHQGFRPELWARRPFRAPHHSASGVALVGGGNPPKPGEISLAHHGILFLDELPEFNRHVLESLREPLESGVITISRAARQVEFPAKFQLIAAMNPCPCGYLGDPDGRCRCTAEQVQRYRARLSGPLLDRIDMQIEVPRLPEAVFMPLSRKATESSLRIRERVERARSRQLERGGVINAALQGKALEAVCVLADEHRHKLLHAIKKWKLSARAYHRVLRVARTIADLADSSEITLTHLYEALSYRQFERGW